MGETRFPETQGTQGRYFLAGASVFEALMIAQRRRQLSGTVNFLAAARQVAENPPSYRRAGAGHVSCEEWSMATQITNRRESDRVPMGVESALPWVPVPSSEKPPKAKSGVLRKLVLALLALVFLLGLWQIGKGLYIQAKAQFAQVLVRDAWERTLAGERQVKPWPWADTWPVARLAVPGQKIDLYVLAGANGRTIAFGPGHLFGTALPGEKGNSVVGGHRDTHLAFLRDVKRGTELEVQRPDGAWRRYRVKAAEVLDQAETWVTRQEGFTRLTLITCYPFDALQAGGPLRYVVFADAIDKKG
jgi:sortase A